MSQHTSRILTIAGSVALWFATPAHAAVVFSDDFEAYAANSTLGTGSLSPWGTANGPAGYRTIRDQTTATPFGSPNQYLQLADTGSSASPAQAITLQSPNLASVSGVVSTLSFDFFEPSTGGPDEIIFGYSRTNADLNTAGGRLRLFLNDGELSGSGLSGGSASYSLDTAYTVYVIFNDSASTVSYAAGAIASGAADVWLQDLGTGAFTFAGTATATGSQTASYRVGFRTFNAPQQELWVDNFVLATGAAAIPEPATGLLFLGSLIPLLLARRRTA